MEEYEKFKAANPFDEDGIQQGLLGLYRDNKVPCTLCDEPLEPFFPEAGPSRNRSSQTIVPDTNLSAPTTTASV